MKWAWRIGQVSGIDIYVHSTFLLLLGWVMLIHYQQGQGFSGALGGVVFTLTLFVIIVLHELGHALTAKRFGIRTRDITLWPIGGVSRLERMPDDPKQEVLVALAGPAVNLALAALLLVILLPTEGMNALGQITFTGSPFLVKLLWVNIVLAVFNLLPAFPMDGGRVLRGVLAMKLDYARATHIAAGIGQAMAFLFGFVGLFTNPFLVFIALFVWIGAAQEAGLVQIRSALGGIPVSRAMITDFRTLSPNDPLERAIAYILAGFQQDFPVVDEGRVVGILTQGRLLKGLAEKGSQTPVSGVMQTQFHTADPHEMLESVFARLQTCDCHSLPIVRDGQLMGIVTMDNLGEFLMIQSALAPTRAGKRKDNFKRQSYTG